MLHRPNHTLGAHEVHIWHLLADRLTEAPTQPLLSAEERGRLGCFRQARDRFLYKMSRVMMRSVLASYLDCHGQEIRFGANSHGKPILHAESDSPRLHFNLTHSRGAIALAVSTEREVGIDIEERHRAVEYLALAERFFAPTEANHLRQLANDHRREAFFAIWTLKEAFVKAIGRGLSFPLDAFCFDLEIDRLVGFRPLADFVSPDWHFFQFDLGDHHRGALAAHNPVGGDVHVTLRDWRTTFLKV